MHVVLNKFEFEALQNCLAALGHGSPGSGSKEEVIEQIRQGLVKAMKARDVSLEILAHQSLYKLLLEMGEAPTPSLKLEHLLMLFRKAILKAAGHRLTVLLRICLGAAVADGTACSEEQEFIRQLMIGVLLPEDEIDKLSAEVISAYNKNPEQFRHDALIASFTKGDVSDWKLVLSLISAIHLVDSKIEPGEKVFFNHFATASRLPQQEIDEIVSETRRVFEIAAEQYKAAGVEERLRERYILSQTIEKMAAKVKRDLVTGFAASGLTTFLTVLAFQFLKRPDYEKLFLFFAQVVFEEQKAKNSEEVIRVEGTLNQLRQQIAALLEMAKEIKTKVEGGSYAVGDVAGKGWFKGLWNEVTKKNRRELNHAQDFLKDAIEDLEQFIAVITRTQQTLAQVIAENNSLIFSHDRLKQRLEQVLEANVDLRDTAEALAR